MMDDDDARVSTEKRESKLAFALSESPRREVVRLSKSLVDHVIEEGRKIAEDRLKVRDNVIQNVTSKSILLVDNLIEEAIRIVGDQLGVSSMADRDGIGPGRGSGFTVPRKDTEGVCYKRKTITTAPSKEKESGKSDKRVSITLPGQYPAQERGSTDRGTRETRLSSSEAPGEESSQQEIDNSQPYCHVNAQMRKDHFHSQNESQHVCLDGNQEHQSLPRSTPVSCKTTRQHILAPQKSREVINQTLDKYHNQQSFQKCVSCIQKVDTRDILCSRKSSKKVCKKNLYKNVGHQTYQRCVSDSRKITAGNILCPGKAQKELSRKTLDENIGQKLTQYTTAYQVPIETCCPTIPLQERTIARQQCQMHKDTVVSQAPTNTQMSRVKTSGKGEKHICDERSPVCTCKSLKGDNQKDGRKPWFGGTKVNKSSPRKPADDFNKRSTRLDSSTKTGNSTNFEDKEKIKYASGNEDECYQTSRTSPQFEKRSFACTAKQKLGSLLSGASGAADCKNGQRPRGPPQFERSLVCNANQKHNSMLAGATDTDAQKSGRTMDKGKQIRHESPNQYYYTNKKGTNEMSKARKVCKCPGKNDMVISLHQDIQKVVSTKKSEKRGTEEAKKDPSRPPCQTSTRFPYKKGEEIYSSIPSEETSLGYKKAQIRCPSTRETTSYSSPVSKLRGIVAEDKKHLGHKQKPPTVCERDKSSAKQFLDIESQQYNVSFIKSTDSTKCYEDKEYLKSRGWQPREGDPLQQSSERAGMGQSILVRELACPSKYYEDKESSREREPQRAIPAQKYQEDKEPWKCDGWQPRETEPPIQHSSEKASKRQSIPIRNTKDNSNIYEHRGSRKYQDRQHRDSEPQISYKQHTGANNIEEYGSELQRSPENTCNIPIRESADPSQSYEYNESLDCQTWQPRDNEQQSIDSHEPSDPREAYDDNQSFEDHEWQPRKSKPDEIPLQHSYESASEQRSCSLKESLISSNSYCVKEPLEYQRWKQRGIELDETEIHQSSFTSIKQQPIAYSNSYGDKKPLQYEEWNPLEGEQGEISSQRSFEKGGNQNPITIGKSLATIAYHDNKSLEYQEQKPKESEPGDEVNGRLSGTLMETIAASKSYKDKEPLESQGWQLEESEPDKFSIYQSSVKSSKRRPRDDELEDYQKWQPTASKPNDIPLLQSSNKETKHYPISIKKASNYSIYESKDPLESQGLQIKESTPNQISYHQSFQKRTRARASDVIEQMDPDGTYADIDPADYDNISVELSVLDEFSFEWVSTNATECDPENNIKEGMIKENKIGDWPPEGSLEGSAETQKTVCNTTQSSRMPTESAPTWQPQTTTCYVEEGRGGCKVIGSKCATCPSICVRDVTTKVACRRNSSDVEKCSLKRTSRKPTDCHSTIQDDRNFSPLLEDRPDARQKWDSQLISEDPPLECPGGQYISNKECMDTNVNKKCPERTLKIHEMDMFSVDHTYDRTLDLLGTVTEESQKDEFAVERSGERKLKAFCDNTTIINHEERHPICYSQGDSSLECTSPQRQYKGNGCMSKDRGAAYRDSSLDHQRQAPCSTPQTVCKSSGPLRKHDKLKSLAMLLPGKRASHDPTCMQKQKNSDLRIEDPRRKSCKTKWLTKKKSWEQKGFVEGCRDVPMTCNERGSKADDSLLKHHSVAYSHKQQRYLNSPSEDYEQLQCQEGHSTRSEENESLKKYVPSRDPSPYLSNNDYKNNRPYQESKGRHSSFQRKISERKGTGYPQQLERMTGKSGGGKQNCEGCYQNTEEQRKDHLSRRTHLENESDAFLSKEREYKNVCYDGDNQFVQSRKFKLEGKDSKVYSSFGVKTKPKVSNRWVEGNYTGVERNKIYKRNIKENVMTRGSQRKSSEKRSLSREHSTGDYEGDIHQVTTLRTENQKIWPIPGDDVTKSTGKETDRRKIYTRNIKENQFMRPIKRHSSRRRSLGREKSGSLISEDNDVSDRNSPNRSPPRYILSKKSPERTEDEGGQKTISALKHFYKSICSTISSGESTADSPRKKGSRCRAVSDDSRTLARHQRTEDCISSRRSVSSSVKGVQRALSQQCRGNGELKSSSNESVTCCGQSRRIQMSRETLGSEDNSYQHCASRSTRDKHCVPAQMDHPRSSHRSRFSHNQPSCQRCRFSNNQPSCQSSTITPKETKESCNKLPVYSPYSQNVAVQELLSIPVERSPYVITKSKNDKDMLDTEETNPFTCSTIVNDEGDVLGKNPEIYRSKSGTLKLFLPGRRALLIHHLAYQENHAYENMISELKGKFKHSPKNDSTFTVIESKTKSNICESPQLSCESKLGRTSFGRIKKPGRIQSKKSIGGLKRSSCMDYCTGNEGSTSKHPSVRERVQLINNSHNLRNQDCTRRSHKVMGKSVK